jgi:hypothetical protein|tara:strand:- start:5022 stop:5234 length:213 start_codon:yes stop_codon:yes gene_type:complete
MPKNKFKQFIWPFILLIVSGIFYHYTNLKRAEAGYFIDPFWITLNGIAWIAFFGIMTATALTFLIKLIKK